MPPNVKNVVEEPEGGWADHSASNSFIDLDISLDLVPSKDYGRRSSASHLPKAKEMRNGNAWGEANELQSNLHIEVGDRSFRLHKFPLISKSGKLNRLVFELRDPGKDRIALHDMPGGANTFEIAMRFLYGKSSLPLTSANVAELRCAAEFLEMNDSLGDGSLVAKTEHYLNLVVVSSWKDSIAVLRACSDLKPWAEELEIVRRCSESVAWKASTDPHGLRWSYSKSTGGRDAPRGWWFDDVCSLQIDTFTKVINAVVAKGMDYTMVAAVVVQYAQKWLGLTKDSKTLQRSHNDSPKSNGSIVAFTGFNRDDASKVQIRNRAILQGIVSLLPSQPDSVSCKFLLKLLRTACAVNAGPMCKTDLARRIGVQLEKVMVDELLIPAYSVASDAMYDIDVVHQMVEYYLQEQNSGSPPLSPTSSAGQSSTSDGTSSTSGSSVMTSSSSDRSVSGSSNSGTSISGTIDSRSSISGTTNSRSSISGTTNSRSSITGTTDSRSSISRSSISGTSVSGSGTSISRTTSEMSDSSGSDESTTTGTTIIEEESVKLDSRFEKSKFFSTEGPTRRPQLPPTSSNLKVARLLETFLEEVAKDSSIPIGKFVALADLFLDFPRESDDCVYRAIDAFLRSHASLNDQERRRLCKVMDIQALSLNACMHAASNERLPVRVVVQVLFTEQVKLRNAITGTAIVNDKGVGSIPASFSSSGSRDTSYSESSSDPLSSSSTSGSDTSTTTLSNSTTTGTSSSSAYSLSIHSVAPSAAPSAAPSVVSSLMPGGLNVKDTLRGALSEIELLRTAVQEIEMVKARLGFMDVLQQEMENINRKFMDLAHDYTGMTHQVEELTKASKHKGGWTSGWKKMAKPFHGKDHPDSQKGYNPTLMSEKHLKAPSDNIHLYQQMNILHPTDVPLLQHLKTTPVQAAVKTPVPEAPKAVPATAKAVPSAAKSTVPAAGVSRIPEAKVETPLKVIVRPKTEAAPKLELAIVPHVQPAPLGAASALPKVNGAGDHHGSKDNYQPPRPSLSKDQPPHSSVSKEQPAQPSLSKDEPARRSVSDTPRNQRDSSSSHHHHHHHHKHGSTPEPREHQSRSKHRSRTPPPDVRHGRHHGKDSDTVSVSSSDYSYSSAYSNPRHRHRDTSSSHRSEDRSHRSNSHSHGGHKSHHRRRDGSRSRSPDDHHRRHHPNSKDPSRPSNASNHKHGSDHHSGHHGHHSKPHRRSHHSKHHHKKDYDSASSYSSDSGSPRPSRPRRRSSAV
ncbi:hypothetical protein KC19_6G206900 [Ceratodon purpureus]|uniref:Uncharacterized protein n=1 Tax=Ceratodon purpureus TaxID=3225 RepID=A0A8T0HJT9_CERPU|nr:hypothetical protein KC19_6G206900 [Ceratodon purpureus]